MSSGANAVGGSSAQSQPQSSNKMTLDDRLDAARSLLGISPSSVALFGGSAMEPTSTTGTSQQAGGEATGAEPVTRPRSNSAGLDALAFCATQQEPQTESDVIPSSATAPPPTQPQHGLRLMPSQDLLQQHQALPAAFLQKPILASAQTHPITSSSDDDSEAMPPPPPRMVTRRRSMSNPEGMDKYSKRRLKLVLPASILEEELAEASAAMKAKEEEEQDFENEEEDEYFTQDEEEEHLSHEELLRRARSRLLEDLSQGSLNGEKGEVTLPHALEKYKEVCIVID